MEREAGVCLNKRIHMDAVWHQASCALRFDRQIICDSLSARVDTRLPREINGLGLVSGEVGEEGGKGVR